MSPTPPPTSSSASRGSPDSPGPARSPEAALQAVRRWLCRRSGGVALLGALAGMGLVFVLAWMLVAEGWPAGSPFPALLVLAALLLVVGIAVALVRYLRRWSHEPILAGEMERESGLAPGALRAQLELDRQAPEGVSPSLIRAGGRSLRDRLGGRPRALAGRPGRELERLLRTSALAAGTVAALALLLVVLSPDRSRAAWAGLANPVAVWAGPELAPLGLEPGDAELPRGTVPEVRVRAADRSRVTLHWQAVGEPLREAELEVVEGMAEYELPPLEGPVRYWASAPDGARSPEARIEPSDPLLLTELAVELHFPEYTRLPNETLRGAPAELSMPRGTRVVLRGRVEGREGSALVLRWADGTEALRTPVEEDRFQGEWRPGRSGEVSWAVEGVDEDGALPDPTRITVEEDLPPEVALPVPGEDGDLPASLRLPLLLEASDDFGLAWIQVEVARVGSDGQGGEPQLERIVTDGDRQVSFRSMLELADWGLEPGDEILLSARAADVSPAEQEGVSPEYRLRVPTAAVQRDAARTQLEEAGARVGELAREADRQAGQLRDREHEARAGGDPGSAGEFQRREEVRGAAEAHQELAREVDRLREEMEATRRGLEGLGDEDGGLRERLRQLESMLSELADPDERARMEELLERLADGETPDGMGELAEMAEAREALRDRLEAALERLQREALEESYLGSEEELQAIAEAQEAVAGELETAEGMEAQEQLARRADELAERLQGLEERLEEAGDPAAAQRAGETAREVSEAERSMSQAAEQARDGQTEGAREEADEAARQLQEALEEMRQDRMEWLEEWEEQIRDALRRGAESSLALARRQEEIRDRIRGAGAVQRSRLQGEEAALAQGARHLAVQLGLATRQAPQVGRRVTEALGEAMDRMERVTEGLGRQGASGAGPTVWAEEAVAALNRAALLALTGMEQVGQGAEGSGMEDLMDELEALAGEQEAINQEAQSLSGDPDQAGAQARMDEMAAAQDQVAGGVEELAERQGGEWTPGDLDEMAREARELARELAEGRLEPETLRRQEDLLERFLGAGRMLERDGPTEEREGTTAGEVERPLVTPLPDGFLRGNRIPLPSAAELEALTPAERRLVLEYFERLNRNAGGGAGGGGEP